MRQLFSLGARFAACGVLILSLCSSLLPSPIASAQGANLATASYVPSTSVLYVGFDTQLLSLQWIQAALLAQRFDPDATLEQLPGILMGTLFQTDIDFNVAPFLGGEMALVFPSTDALLDDANAETVVENPGETAGDLAEGVVIIAIPSDLPAAERELTAVLDQQAADRNQIVEESTYRDRGIRFLPSNLVDGEPGLAIVNTGDALLLATSPAQLEPFIDRADGVGESISDLDAWAAATSPLPESRLLLGFLNGPALMADALELEGFGPAIEAFIPGGANAATGFAVRSESDGFRVDTHTVSTNGEPLRTFGEHFEPALLSSLPAETQIGVSGNDFADTRLIDGVFAILFNAIFSSLGDMFVDFASEATPEAIPTTLDGAAAAAYALASSLLGIDLQRDLVDLIDEEYLLGIWNVGGTFSDPRVGFISETSDPAQVAQSLSGVTLVAGFLTGSNPATSAAGLTSFDIDGGELAVGVIDDTFVTSFGGGGEALLERPELALIDTPLFQTVTEPLPADRSLLIYVNIEALQAGAAPVRMPGTFGLARTPLNGPAFAFAMFNDGEDLGGQGYVYIPEP